MKKFYLIVIIALILISSINMASAKTYHMKLLTVGEVGDSMVGGTADAFLEIKPGSGRIFLDSFPLTKIDTQISTRYANKIACDYLDMDCSGHDFFYTIRAGSTIVGGPSASGPLTILTIAGLKNIELDNETVMTGTINSGGSIGPVGGVVKKAIAAEKEGFKRILVPRFSINMKEIQNNTGNSTETNESVEVNVSEEVLDIDEANLSIEVVKISNIDEALIYFTGKEFKQYNGDIVVPEDYTNIMKGVANNLCDRALELSKKIKLEDENLINKSEMYQDNIKKGFEEKDYYSSASYCFTMGLMLRRENIKQLQEINPVQFGKLYDITKKAVNEFNKNLEQKNLTTLSELETYIIVKERLVETEDSLIKSANNISADEFAYAIERYYSAVYWSEFFKLKGESIELDKEYLREACYKKISEAEERINYASIYIPLSLQSSRSTMKQAYAFSVQENYKMCLFKASFAKAESNLLLSTIALGNEQVKDLADEKLKSAKKVIVKEQSRGFFPILGYSYYEYANSLNNNGDELSGLIFGEYALELSNIEIYFPKKEFKFPRINYPLIPFYLSALTLGLAIGILIGTRVLRKKGKKKKKRKK